MTVLQLILSALRLIGQLGPGRLAGPSELADALFALNRMIECWRNDRLLVYAIDRQLFPLVASQSSYSIGASAANWLTARPLALEGAGIMIDSATELGMTVLSEAQYQDLSQKGLTSTFPNSIYYRPTVPLGSMLVWPVPVEVRNVALYLRVVLSSFATTADTVTLPDGYGDLIRYNLAVRLAPEWGRPLRPEVVELANQAMRAVKVTNAVSPEMRCDAALLKSGGTFDWRDGR